MKYYVFHKENEEFAYVICTEKEIKKSYLTEFNTEEDAWDYAEGLSGVAVVTDDIPYELKELW